jgi:hypothetical protein
MYWARSKSSLDIMLGNRKQSVELRRCNRTQILSGACAFPQGFSFLQAYQEK